MTAAVGCSNKPPRDVHAAVRGRLTRYSDAWEQGDAAGVRESFHARDADEAALRDALAELAAARATLRAAFAESLAPEDRALFADGDADELVIGLGRWDARARAARSAQRLRDEKPLVVARVDGDKEDVDAFELRNVGGDWKIAIDALLPGGDVSQLVRATRRQTRHANALTAAVRSRDTSRIHQVMLRHIAEARGPSQGVRDDYDEAPRPATRPRGAKENPP